MFIFLNFLTDFVRSSRKDMTLCLHDRLYVCRSVFIFGMHVPLIGPGRYIPNVFGDAALINYANLCKICQSVNILVYTFLHFGILFLHFVICKFS